MISVHSHIKGVKEEVKRQFVDNIGDSNSSNRDGGWKDLLPLVKNNPVQIDHINQVSKEKFFNSKARIIENPVETAFQYRICVSCGKPIALNAIMDHLENHCQGSRDTESFSKMKKDIEYESTNANSGRSNSEDIPTTPTQDSKRFKENSETPQGTSKRQRKVKQRNPTEKHLIDFDKQCGVELPEGGYCARSLTCKSHSMGAKRAVEGRSQPFDTLLAEYHKQHQTKIGAAAEKRAKQQKVQKQQKQVEREHKKQLQQQRQGQRKNKSSGSSQNNVGKGKSGNSTDKSANHANNHGSYITLSPEEETTQVLNGVSRSFPLPLESTVLSSVRHRTKYFRMREMFASAFSVKPGYTVPGYGAIHSRVGCIDIDRTTDYKFRIRTPQPMNQVPQGATPQQLQKLQHQRMLQAQLMQMQKENHTQQGHSEFQQRARAAGAHLSESNNAAQAVNSMQKSNVQQNVQENGFTPQEIQQQQQKLRQQQLQQQRFEAAAFHLANATKLMQGSSPESSNNMANSPPSSSINQSLGSPIGGRVNVGIGYTTK